jgi:hypothetical protein
VDRLPPGRQCAESDDDERMLAVFMEAIEQAHSLDRHSVRDRAAEEFDSDRIVDSVITALPAIHCISGYDQTRPKNRVARACRTCN